MNWYCIRTKSQRETYTAQQLSENLSLEVFFPQMRRQKLIRRVRRMVVEPMFPQYLFCRFEVGSFYRAVRYTHEVIDILSFGAAPTVVDEGLVEQLREWSTQQMNSQAPSLFSCGDRVQITDGPMRGLEAVIMRDHSAGDRVAVLLSILGCDAQLTIRSCQLAKAV